MKKALATVALFWLQCWREIESLSVHQQASTSKTASSSSSRRTFLSEILQPSLLLSGGVILVSPPSRCHARNVPQSTGADSDKTGTVEALTPIVRLRHSLNGPVANLPHLIPRDEQAFKRLFDEYSDPISYKQKFLDQNAFLVYYTRGFDGPNRPPIEQDLPERQTLQYGTRNEAWVSWEELQVELEFAKKYPEDPNDVEKYLGKLIDAVDAYLLLAPPNDVQQARNNVTK